MIHNVGAQFIAPNYPVTRTQMGAIHCAPTSFFHQHTTDRSQNATVRNVGAQFIAPNPQSSCRYNHHLITPIEGGAMNCAPTSMALPHGSGGKIP